MTEAELAIEIADIHEARDTLRLVAFAILIHAAVDLVQLLVYASRAV